MANNCNKRFFTKMSSDIKEMFAKLQDALKSRETQLLRQIEVLSQHCQLTESYDKYAKEISLVFDHSNDLFQSITNLGKINLSGLHCTSEVFQIEDYQKQEIDHDSFNKYLDKSDSNSKIESSSKIVSSLTKEDNHKDDNHKEDIHKEDTHKQCTKEKCETEIETTKSNSVLECIGKDDPKLCHHNTNKILTDNEINNCDTEYQCNCFVINNQRKCVCDCSKTLECINCNDLIDDKVRKISLQQSVPIQHWMNDIILKTELEPTSNNIMEHSQIEEK